ncbi:MAG: aminocarboxycyclopropane-forming enzyme [Candidatus Eremiobacteraeota bacterium]|jgi:aminocarboxycyclopropane-forming enzyme|nr:aminocarboxycyclopropane-forming enzyme [Candidatus Eremiobacteraeota bacterium]
MADVVPGFDHVSYATLDTDATVEILRALGFELHNYKEGQSDFDVFISKMVGPEGDVVEVVEPRSADSAVSKLLRDQNQKTMVYHTCFRTDDFEGTCARLKRAGALTVSKPGPVQVALTPEHRTYRYTHMFHPFLGVFEVTGPVKP